MTDREREFYLTRRRALLLELQAIEKLLCTPKVTITVTREEAERLQPPRISVESR